MNPAPEEDFDALRKLLALKRHEVPPPGYFTGFSARVCARIEAAEAAQPVRGWRQLLATFDAKPVLACTYGLAVGGLTLFAVYVASTVGSDNSGSPANGAASILPAPALQTAPTEFAGNPFLGNEAGTNALPGATPPNFLVHPGELKTERVDFKRNTK